jgi:hypothetical protein
VTKIKAMIVINLVAPEAGAKHELLFNKSASVYPQLEFDFKVHLHVRFHIAFLLNVPISFTLLVSENAPECKIRQKRNVKSDAQIDRCNLNLKLDFSDPSGVRQLHQEDDRCLDRDQFYKTFVSSF